MYRHFSSERSAVIRLATSASRMVRRSRRNLSFAYPAEDRDGAVSQPRSPASGGDTRSTSTAIERCRKFQKGECATSHLGEAARQGHPYRSREDLRRRRRSRPLPAGRELGRRHRQHPQRRYLRQRLPLVTVEPEGPLQGGKRQLVDAHRPQQRMFLHRLQAALPADDDPCLRTAEELVAAEGYDIHAGPDKLLDRRLANPQ